MSGSACAEASRARAPNSATVRPILAVLIIVQNDFMPAQSFIARSAHQGNPLEVPGTRASGIGQFVPFEVQFGLAEPGLAIPCLGFKVA